MRISVRRMLRKALRRYRLSDYMRISYLKPRLVVLATTRHGKSENILPLDWHIPLSMVPMLYGIVLESDNYSRALIEKSGTFVVNFMAADFESQMLACGSVSGRDVDKFALTGLKKAEATVVDAPVLVDALGYLECSVVRTVEVGDHTMFVGRVLHERCCVPDDKRQFYHVSFFNDDPS